MKSKSLLTTLASFATLAWPGQCRDGLPRPTAIFPIGGSTLEEIQRQLDVRGPKVKTTGHRHPGATQMEFTSPRRLCPEPATAARSPRQVVTVKAKIILPRWTAVRPRRSRCHPDLGYVGFQYQAA